MTINRKASVMRKLIGDMLERDKDLTAQQIGARLGVSPNRIKQIARDLGLPVRNKQPAELQ